LKYLKITKSVRSATTKTEIQQLIASSSVALSHFEIQKSLKGLCYKVIIYCVLERLLVEGVIHKIDNVDGVLKYAFCHS
jgi:Fur family ferric uptake transcriptional regulator